MKKFDITAILILILTLNIVNGCMDRNDEEFAFNPYGLISTYIHDLNTGNYTEACSNLIYSNGEFLVEMSPDNCESMVIGLENQYGVDGNNKMIKSYSIKNITSSIKMENNGKLKIYSYEIIINLSTNYGDIYSISYIEVIDNQDTGTRGVLINGSKNLFEMVNIFPIWPLEEDFRLEIYSSNMTYSSEALEILINVSLINTCYFPIIQKEFWPGGSLNWNLISENETGFVPVLIDSDHMINYFIMRPEGAQYSVVNIQISYRYSDTREYAFNSLHEDGNYTIQFYYYYYPPRPHNCIDPRIIFSNSIIIRLDSN